jgi:hypothetical protein
MASVCMPTSRLACRRFPAPLRSAPEWCGRSRPPRA